MIGINRQIGKFPLPVFFAISNIKLSVCVQIIVSLVPVIDIILIPCGGHDPKFCSMPLIPAATSVPPVIVAVPL